MEYLETFAQKLSTINEEGITYYDLMTDIPFVLYGIHNFSVHSSFDKYPYEMLDKNSKDVYGALAKSSFERLKNSATSCRLRFKTNSNTIIFRIELKRRWSFLRMNLYNSSGFDVYKKIQGQWVHHTVFAPKEGHSIFAYNMVLPKNTEIMVFCPNYNEIVNLSIGSKSPVCAINPYEKALPICFYGNSITQGAAASRSGNSYPNIVSRMLDSDIYNFSLTGCCQGNIEVAENLKYLNLSAFVIDYNKNALSAEYLKKTHEKFYLKIREYHPNIPIIIMGNIDFFAHKAYEKYEGIIKETVLNAEARGENTFYIAPHEVLPKNLRQYLSVDANGHLTEMGMYLLAEKVVDILKSAWDNAKK